MSQSGHGKPVTTGRTLRWRYPPPFRETTRALTATTGGTRSGTQIRVHESGNIRTRDAEHLGKDLGVLRTSVAVAKARRLRNRSDRPATDDHGARPGQSDPGALQPLPPSWRTGVRQPTGQHRL